MGENEMGITVSFLKFLYRVLTRIKPLMDPGLPISLSRNSSKQMKIANLHGTTDLSVRIFSTLYLLMRAEERN
jgi:hypothetical protein